jgi:hypothetical protein
MCDNVSKGNFFVAISPVSAPSIQPLFNPSQPTGSGARSVSDGFDAVNLPMSWAQFNGPTPTPSTSKAVTVQAGGQTLSFSSKEALNQYWQATYNKAGLSSADQAVSQTLLNAYYAAARADTAAAAKANAVNPSSLVKDVLPMDPQMVHDAQQMLANYQNVATERGFGGNATIPNSVYDAAGGNWQQLRQTLMGDGTATYGVRQPIPPYDPAQGPRITMDMVTPEMLIQPYTNDLLKNMVDPAAFMNMRRALLQAPTDARVVNPEGGSEPLNPIEMSTLGQAQAVQGILQQNGIPGGGITDLATSFVRFTIDYGTDPRKLYQVGDMNVGLVLNTFAESSWEQVMASLQGARA